MRQVYHYNYRVYVIQTLFMFLAECSIPYMEAVV